MHAFVDNAGRTWTISVTVDSIKRVRALLNVDLLQMADGKLIEQLVNDPILLCDVLYALCKPEADTKKVSDEDFGRAMAGDAIDLATTALLEDLVDFFPQGKRRLLTKALSKLRQLEEKALAYAEARLESQDLERQLEVMATEASQTPRLSLPGPGPGPGAGAGPGPGVPGPGAGS